MRTNALGTSCDIGQKSYEYDAKYQGAFSWFLKEGLGGEADRDRDGFIRASELNLYVNDKVSRWAAQRGVKQTPKFTASVIGDPVLAWCPKPPGQAPAAPAAPVRAAPAPAAPARDPNRFDIIVMKTGRTVECEAMEVGDRVIWKRAGMNASFHKKDVLEVRYGAGASKESEPITAGRVGREKLIQATAQGTVYVGTLSSGSQREFLRLSFIEQKGVVVRAEASNPDRPDQGKQTFVGELVAKPEPEPGRPDVVYTIVLSPTGAQTGRDGRWEFYERTGTLKLRLTEGGMEGEATMGGGWYGYTIRLQRETGTHPSAPLRPQAPMPTPPSPPPGAY